ncbi:unnamed protein product, partial [Ectocarpus sp. 12 AP-2014]
WAWRAGGVRKSRIPYVVQKTKTDRLPVIEGFTVLMLGAERRNVQRLQSRAISVSLSPRRLLCGARTHAAANWFKVVSYVRPAAQVPSTATSTVPLITNELADFRQKQ